MDCFYVLELLSISILILSADLSISLRGNVFALQLDFLIYLK